MSRLADTEYLIRHEMVHRAWKQDKRLYTHLSFSQQRDIHDYYLGARHCTEAELLEHRQQVTKKDPSLPHRASRAFLAMLRPSATPPAPTGKLTHRGTRLSVRPLVRPDPDLDAIAKVVLDVVRNMSPEERAKLAAASRQREGRRAA